MQYLTSMKLWRHTLIVLGLAVLLGNILPATPSSAETIEPFCEHFDDGTGWQGRWTTTVGSQTAVDTIWHSATQAIQFTGSCHSAMYRSGFSGAQGEYEAHVNQQHHQAGFAMHIQVQGEPGNPFLLEGYTFRLQASDAQAPSGMVLEHTQDGGGGSTLGTKTPTQFVKGEWIKVFIRRIGSDTIIAGYERPGGFRDSLIGVDPSPITNPGSFYLWACSDVTPYTFFDDVCFTPSYRSDLFGNSQCFNGTDHYILVDDSSTLNVTSGLTIEAWINLDTLPPTNLEYAIASKWGGPGSGGGRYLFGVWGGPTPGQLLLNLQDRGLLSTTSLLPHRWYHVAATYNGSVAKIYIDGMEDSSATIASSFGSSTTDFAIGKNIHNNTDPSVGAYYFKGKIDELRISNIARSSYEFCLAAPCSSDGNTVALWHLDETTQSVFQDASGHGNLGFAQGKRCDGTFACCAGLTGNVDCDPTNGVDISDLTALVDNLYISFAPLCCKAEANVDGSPDGNADISDLTGLVDYLYISFTPPKPCL